MATSSSASPAVAVAARAQPERRPSVYWEAFQGLRRDPVAMAALAILLIVAFLALAGPVVAPYDPNAQSLSTRLRPPVWSDRGSAANLLGTDQLGRDMLSRIIYGARVSAIIGLAVVCLGAIAGVTLGLVAGFFGGKIEKVIVSVIDTVLSFPGLLLSLTVVAVFGANMTTLILALSLRAWVVYARIVRGQTLILKQVQFIEAARSLGIPTGPILARHLLPNLLPSILTIAVLELARVVLSESSLSFLGLGIQSPSISWGLMLAEGRRYMSTANWLVTTPGIAIAITVLSVNVLASYIRRLLDPFQRGRIEMHER